MVSPGFAHQEMGRAVVNARVEL